MLARIKPCARRSEIKTDVVDVTLAAGNIADMSGISEHELEPTLQHVPDRLPVDARSLHRYVRDPLGRQPIRELQKIVRRC